MKEQGLRTSCNVHIYIYMYLYHDTVYANAKFFELVHGPVDGLLQFRWFGG